MFETPLARFGLVLLIGVTAYAWLVGGRLLRCAALLVAANWILNNLLVVRHDVTGMPWADFALDTAFAGLFIGVAVKSRRAWAAFLAAFQLLGVANYVSYLMDLAILHRTFMTTSYLWGFLALGAVLAGSLDARRRRLGRPTGQKRYDKRPD